jgi:hypothetical protein
MDEAVSDQQDERIWSVRLLVYQFLVEHERPPISDETALALGVSVEQAREAYRNLHRRHTLFLEPGTLDVRMAHPFFAPATAFEVHIGPHTYYATAHGRCWVFPPRCMGTRRSRPLRRYR